MVFWSQNITLFLTLFFKVEEPFLSAIEFTHTAEPLVPE